MVMEVLLDPNKEMSGDDSIVITQFNVSKAIKDSILVNFGECGLASSLGSFQVKYVNSITKLCIIRASRDEYKKFGIQLAWLEVLGTVFCYLICWILVIFRNGAKVKVFGSIKACKTAALKCDELKFEQYKLMVGARLSVDVIQHMQNCIEKIKILEH
ncbi:hypothetical protein CXB51_009229 [Gossypium anomalum]|uniref:Uncharacterized protein n=1 Tax=Gossypium anomalum TaxID=47600 RepID=A0A8J5Z7F4_9ROSI|nr:hypothetical protein CXB51_009229 [Gossypium anomalum]